jgi:hypothetical protein
MPVIINDFEVLVEPPAPPPPRQGADAGSEGSGQRLRPQDIERIVRHFERRRERVRAD